MSDNNEALIKNVDLDLEGVSAAPPLLDKQTLRCKVGECGVKKTDKGKRRMVIPLILEEPGKSTLGQDVQVGFRVTHSFLLDESGGWTEARAKQEFLRTKMAVLGVDEATAKSLPNDVESWTGKEVYAPFAVKRGNDGEENQNVGTLKPVRR